MDGSMVKTAVYQFNEGDHQVAFTLTDEGAKIFADMTSNNIGKTLGIYLDGEELLAPTRAERHHHRQRRDYPDAER